jgi:hypothetical protein
MALKLKLVSGDEHVVQFDASSTLTVANQIQTPSPAGGVESYTDSKSWSEIADVSIVDDSELP